MKKFIFAILVNGTGPNLCTQVMYHDGSCSGMLMSVHVKWGDCVRYRLVVILIICIYCTRIMPTLTIMNYCTSGTKSCKFILMVFYQ